MLSSKRLPEEFLEKVSEMKERNTAQQQEAVKKNGAEKTDMSGSDEDEMECQLDDDTSAAVEMEDNFLALDTRQCVPLELEIMYNCL